MTRCSKCQVAKKASAFGYQKALCVDHCHNTGKVRGLLCSGCNAALGNARECPETLLGLIKYIERFKP